MVEPLPSKHKTRVRFPSPAPNNAAIAQLAERLICNQDVRGSIPRGGTNIILKENFMDFLKGYRTIVFNVATVVVALAEMTDVFNVVAPGSGPTILLAVGIANLVLRFLTNTPVGLKTPE